MARTSHSLQVQNRRVGESLPLAISTSSRLQAGGQEDSSRVEKGVRILPALELSWGCWEKARGDHLLSTCRCPTLTIPGAHLPKTELRPVEGQERPAATAAVPIEKM